MARGAAREIYCYGARGDGKTFAALWGMVFHAIEHEAAGFALPVTWLGLRDTHENHKLSTHKTLRNPAWEGRWRIIDGGKVALYVLEGVVLVRLELVGADSADDANRLRTECHGLWVDEPAPAMGVSGGISEDLYGIAFSSQRLETHARVAILTSNAPEEDDWTWQRFVEHPIEGTMAVHIPAGERATPEYRAELERAYARRPDLRRRLLEGLPGAIILGQAVAEGYEEERHAPPGLNPKPTLGVRLVVGQDGGLTPTSVVFQRVGQRVRVLAAFQTEHGGILQHFRFLLRPWLSEHAPWALVETDELLEIVYDPSMDVDDFGDSDNNPLRIMQAQLPATYTKGPVAWEKRKNPVLELLNANASGPVLQIVREQTHGLRRALRGGWHYKLAANGKPLKDEPVKNHPHSDYGDAFAYGAGVVLPVIQPRPARGVQYAQTSSSPYGTPRTANGPARRYATV